MFYYHHLKLTLIYVTFSKLNLFFKKYTNIGFFLTKKPLSEGFSISVFERKKLLFSELPDLTLIYVAISPIY